MTPLIEGELFADIPQVEGTRAIKDRCLLRTQDGHSVVLVAGLILAQYAAGDRMAEAHAIISLVDQGWANQVEVAPAFGCSTRTVRRLQRRFEQSGLAGLGQPTGYPRGRARLAGWREQLVQRLKSQGYAQREIARRIGVTENAVRKVLRRLEWKTAPPIQAELPLAPDKTAHPNLSAFADASSPASPAKGAAPHPSAVDDHDPRTVPASVDADPSNRCGDRLLARLGLLEDAPPLFGCARAVARDGVLLALPVLVASGVFDCAKKIYGSLGPAFYGLRTSLLTLLLMALWRIKRPEALK
jgi:transposase